MATNPFLTGMQAGVRSLAPTVVKKTIAPVQQLKKPIVPVQQRPLAPVQQQSQSPVLGQTSKGIDFDTSHPEVQSFLQQYPNVSPEAAVGIVASRNLGPSQAPPPSTTPSLPQETPSVSPVTPQQQPQQPTTVNSYIADLLNQMKMSDQSQKDLQGLSANLGRDRFSAISNVTPTDLRSLSPDRQSSLRNLDVRGIDNEVARIEADIKNRQQDRQNLLDMLQVQQRQQEIDANNKYRQMELDAKNKGTAAEGFTLGEGQQRFDAQGNLIAKGSQKQEGITPYQQAQLDIEREKMTQGKAPNVDQSKARQFAVSANNANKVLDTVGYDPGWIEIWKPSLFKGAKREQFEQAARAFVNSVLRRESGATITDDEFKNKYKELIPLQGEGTEVKEQKAAARSAAVKSITEAGGQGFSVDDSGGDALDNALKANGIPGFNNDLSTSLNGLNQSSLKKLTNGVTKLAKIGLGTITGIDGSSLWKAGLDFQLKGGKGAPVPSPFTGTVVFAGQNKGFGNQVKVRLSDGNELWLSHLDSINVTSGSKINAGQLIGTQGNTGSVLGGSGEKLTKQQVAQGRGTHLDLTMKKPNGQYYTAREVAALLGDQRIQMT